MVAIALVAESLSFVIEFLGCVMAIFYRIWARAVSTSWRGALHQLYTRLFWHEWNVYCCVSATAPATAATASASGDDHTEKLWTSSYLNAPSCHIRPEVVSSLLHMEEEAEEELCTSTTSTEAGERLVMAIFYRTFIRTLSSL